MTSDKEKNTIFPIDGIMISSVEAEIRKKNELDLSLVSISEGSTVSGVFTTSKTRSPVIDISEKNILSYTPKYLIINSGNANAGLGKIGKKDVNEYCEYLSKRTNTSINEICPFSTGVIGERISVKNIKDKIPFLIDALDKNSWENFSKSIMTTDTFNKIVSKKINISNTDIFITGVAKGSGMIMPNMATMLSFVATNLNINKEDLDKILTNINKNTYNAISVDGDMSTNDSSILIATGKSNLNYIDCDNKDKDIFITSLQNIYKELSMKIVKDGEGATKIISIHIKKAKSNEYAKEIGMSIANSPLVKTAFFAEDPNWGRILAAIGNSKVDDKKLENFDLFIGDQLILKDGEISNDYDESKAKSIMMQDNVEIIVNINNGSEEFTVLTTDLSHKYIEINASYRS